MKFINRLAILAVNLQLYYILINSQFSVVKCENMTHEEGALVRIVTEFRSGRLRQNLTETLNYRINRRLEFVDEEIPFARRANTFRPSTLSSSTPYMNRDPLWNSNNRFTNRFELIDKFTNNRRFTNYPTFADLSTTHTTATTTSRPRYYSRPIYRPSNNSFRPYNNSYRPYNNSFRLTTAASSNLWPVNVKPSYARPDKSALSKYNADCACRRKIGNGLNSHPIGQETTTQMTTSTLKTNNQRQLRARNFHANRENEKPYDPRIVNGTTANYYQVPWMVSLGRAVDGKYTNDSHYCGATLISPNYIMTSAHCLTDFKPQKMLAAYGSGNRNEMKHFAEVDRVILHPNYSGWPRYLNDIALVKLKESVRLDGSIKPACLLHSNSIQLGKGFDAIGWGRTGVEEEFPASLQKSKFEHVTLNDCRARWDKELDHPDITANNICVFNPHSDICGGDSGSPLVNSAEDGMSYVVGVASFTNFCDKTQPAVYVSILPYIDWIVAIVKNFC